MIYPKPLMQNYTIGLIAPAGPLKNIEISEVAYALNNLGYNVKVTRTCHKPYKGYLSGTDEERARELETMFLDNEVDVILCLRGGYGTTRILNLIDFDIIKNNPKIFIGFSDITALHIAINQICDLVTYHGIMAGSINKWDLFTYNSLISALNFHKELLIENPDNEEIVSLYDGRCSGKIIGGNLSLIVSTLGTAYEIDTKDKILFIEEVDEYTYKIDKMLNQLEMANKIKECSGIIFGEFTDCKPASREDDTVHDVIKEFVLKNKKPTLCNVKSGHSIPMVTIPLNAKCFMDTYSKEIRIVKN